MKLKVMTYRCEDDAKKIAKQVKKRGCVIVIDCAKQDDGTALESASLSLLSIGSYSSQPLEQVKKGQKGKSPFFEVYVVYREPTARIQKKVDKIGKKMMSTK